MSITYLLYMLYSFETTTRRRYNKFRRAIYAISLSLTSFLLDFGSICCVISFQSTDDTAIAYPLTRSILYVSSTSCNTYRIGHDTRLYSHRLFSCRGIHCLRTSHSIIILIWDQSSHFPSNVRWHASRTGRDGFGSCHISSLFHDTEGRIREPEPRRHFAI